MPLSEFLNAYSALIQALATVVLVILTAYYVREVKKSADELERTRQSEFLPILSVSVMARGPRTLDVSLSNIGHGLAQHPQVMLPFVDPQSAGEVIAPGQESVLVTLENVGTPEVLELPPKKRVLIVEYGDIFGRVMQTVAYLRKGESEDGEIENELLAMADWEVVLPTGGRQEPIGTTE